MVAFYQENARILKATFQEMGFSVSGGRSEIQIWAVDGWGCGDMWSHPEGLRLGGFSAGTHTLALRPSCAQVYGGEDAPYVWVGFPGAPSPKFWGAFVGLALSSAL